MDTYGLECIMGNILDNRVVSFCFHFVKMAFVKGNAAKIDNEIDPQNDKIDISKRSKKTPIETSHYGASFRIETGKGRKKTHCISLTTFVHLFFFCSIFSKGWRDLQQNFRKQKWLWCKMSKGRNDIWRNVLK